MTRIPVDGTRSWLPLALAAGLAPPSYFGYAVGVESVRHGRTLLRSPLSGGMLLASGGLAAVGALAIVARRRGYVVTPFAAVGVPAGWPWLYTSVPAGGTHVLIPVVVVLLVATGETLGRRPRWLARLFDGGIGRLALAVGVVHFAFGFSAQVLARPYWLSLSGSLWYTWLLVPGVLLVSGLGLVAVGTVPVLLWHEHGLRSPGLLVGGWALAAVAWLVEHAGSPAVSQFSGVMWARPKPAPDYMATWVVPLAGIAVVAGIEFALRRLFARIDWLASEA